LKAEKNTKPDCKKCGFIELDPECFLIIGLIEKYSGFFIDGNGALNPAGIKMAVDLEGIPDDEKPETVRLIGLYLNSALRAQRGN